MKELNALPTTETRPSSTPLPGLLRDYLAEAMRRVDAAVVDDWLRSFIVSERAAVAETMRGLLRELEISEAANQHLRVELRSIRRESDPARREAELNAAREEAVAGQRAENAALRSEIDRQRSELAELRSAKRRLRDALDRKGRNPCP
jgi:predicted RNase H-like nuclease (RuvC/YqgF family)